MLATSGTDYTDFFRAISSFSIVESKYTLQINYQPNGLHSPGTLRKNSATDVLTLLLKSQLRLCDYQRTVAKANTEEAEKQKNSNSIGKESSWPLKKNNRISALRQEDKSNRSSPNLLKSLENLFKDKLSEEQPKKEGAGELGLPELPLKSEENHDSTPALDQKVTELPPSSPEQLEHEAMISNSLATMAHTWTMWAHMYRSRLLAQLPANRKSPEAIADEDSIRQKKLKAHNPKFALRGWILEDLMAEIATEMKASPDLTEGGLM